MSIYGNIMAAVGLLVVIYIVYAIIREYTGVTTCRGILVIIKMRKEERYRLRQVALTPETTILRDKYRKVSKDIKNRISELQSRSGVDKEILYLYSAVWLIQNMLPNRIAQQHMDKLYAILNTQPLSTAKLLQHVTQLVNNELVDVELPVILRQAVLNTLYPTTPSDQECILLNVIIEFMNTLPVDMNRTNELLYYGTP